MKLLIAGTDTPPALLAMAVTEAGPAANVRLEQAYVPEAEAVVIHDWLFGPSTVTLANGVAVPDTVGVVVAVPLLAGETMATVGTATVVKVTGTEVVPPGPEAVTVRVFGPTGSGEESAQAYVPEAEAVVLQSVTGPGPVITMLLPGVAVPAIVGVVVVETFTGEVTVRLGGPMAVKLLMAVFDKPPVLLAMAVTLVGPAANVRLLQA